MAVIIPTLDFVTSQFAGFFLTVFLVYWALPRHRWRLLWLLGASCLFYMSYHPWLIGLIALSASIDYFVARRLEKITSPRLRRGLVALSVSGNLGILAVFKYSNFFLANAQPLLGLLGLETQRPLFQLILPLGISFYTFEAISYVVDVYRGKLPAVKSLLDYALYIMFFPHLAAGPIVRPRDFLPQLGRRKRFSWYRVVVGLFLFLAGMFKKAVLADNLGPIVDPVFAAPGNCASSTVWLAALGYSVQIYCDFSGYSDMAMGLAHMLGFKLPANFALPYFAADPAEFWRRWHISLSSWLRDYLYIPLGGNRRGEWATYRNLFLTMLLGGLWHGASWTFVLWGGYHGLLLAAHRACPRPRWLSAAGWRPLFVATTFLSVCVGWVLFRAESFEAAGTLLVRMVTPTVGLLLPAHAVVAVAAALTLVFAGHLYGTFGQVRFVWRRLPAPVLGGVLALLLLLVMLLSPDDAGGFIYFHF